MTKLSVIVPIYNTQTYLKQCLDSILNQTLKGIEIILINDGSTDDSGKILNEYANQYPDQITLIEQENQGMSIARNKGIDIAKGKYLGFVDSDDWVLETMFEEMTQMAEANHFDIVICDTIDHYPKYKVPHSASVFESKYTVTPSACNKIFLKEFVGDLRFPENLWYEDFCFTTLALMNTEAIGTIQKPFYNCHCREVSIMSNDNSNRNLDILKVLDIIKETMIKNNHWDRDYMIHQYLVLDHVLITSINRVAEQNNSHKTTVIKAFLDYAKSCNLDFDAIQKQFQIPSKRMLVAKLNYRGHYAISKLMLSIMARLKGRK